MEKMILLNGKSLSFNMSFLPCLITGAAKSGASFFSIIAIAQLIQKGAKVVFFSAYPMARDALLQQIWPSFCYEVNDHEDVLTIPSHKSILIQSGNISLWNSVMTKIQDHDDYVFFVKNFEKYETSLFDTLSHCRYYLLSGSLDDCSFQKNLIQQQRSSIICFTPPLSDLGFAIPALEPYHAYLFSELGRGFLTLTEWHTE